MASVHDTDREAAEAILAVLGESRWEVVTFARGYLRVLEGGDPEEAAREMYQRGPQTLRRCRALLEEARSSSFLASLPERKKTGSAENPITKLFPGAITEERFVELLDVLCSEHKTLEYLDERKSNSLADFRLRQGEQEVPTNIKTAGTRFEKAKVLVGLDPNDCIPIPAYKANRALEIVPNLIYVVSPDYDLISKLDKELPKIFERNEAIVWEVLNRSGGSLLRDGEDNFVYGMVRKHRERLTALSADKPFHVISARKAIRILQTKPQRTPGIGLRAWGTGASAEVNVHVSVREDTTPWDSVCDRITSKGIGDVLQAVNRKLTEEVYDPEI